MDVYTDGSGDGRYIYVIPGKKIVKIFQKRGLTNNEAEYFGIIEALKQNKDKNICIYSDSKLVINQVNKKWKVKEPHLKPLVDQVRKLCEERNITFTWIPREKNKAGYILG